MCDLRRRFGGVAVLAALCLSMNACARPVGDLGRVQHGVLHDQVLPTVGTLRADLSGEPVAGFNVTDEERDMQDRVWRFLVAPHARDWFMDTAVELQRTRLASDGLDRRFEPARYFRWLHQERFASSRIRFRTIADHAKSDIDTAPATFRAICAVVEIDRQRAVASRELSGIGRDEVVARQAENAQRIGWFTRALRYRYDAYSFALDRLLVETPHEEAREADSRLSELGVWVERAERGDFCGDSAVRLTEGGHMAIPSRVLMGGGHNIEYRK